MGQMMAHAYPMTPGQCKSERMPHGTAWVGRLYRTPDGGLVVTDGDPAGLPWDDPLVHDCDEMGCTTVSHVVARLRPSPDSGEGEGPDG